MTSEKLLALIAEQITNNELAAYHRGIVAAANLLSESAANMIKALDGVTDFHHREHLIKQSTHFSLAADKVSLLLQTRPETP